MTITDLRVVLMTVPDAAAGNAIVRRLLEQHLVACGSVLPDLQSVFRWEGQIEAETEALVILKTSVERLSSMMEMAVALHPYEVPEILALPVAEAWAPYADWVLGETLEEATP